MVNYKMAKVYKIVNDINDHIYIGSTCKTLAERMTRHRSDMRNDAKCKRALYANMRELGLSISASFFLKLAYAIIKTNYELESNTILIC